MGNLIFFKDNRRVPPSHFNNLTDKFIKILTVEIVAVFTKLVTHYNRNLFLQ